MPGAPRSTSAPGERRGRGHAGELGLPADHRRGRWAGGRRTPRTAPGPPPRAAGPAVPPGACAAVRTSGSRCAGRPRRAPSASAHGGRARRWARPRPTAPTPRRAAARRRGRRAAAPAAPGSTRRRAVRAGGRPGTRRPAPSLPRGRAERSTSVARRSYDAMSVSTPRPGNSATRPPASRTACSEPSTWRAKWAALRRFAAPAAGDRCGHSASMTWSRTSRCPSASASRATSSAARRVGHASSATTNGPTVTVSPPRSAMRTRSSATSNNAIGGRRGKVSTSPRRVGLKPAP